MTKKTIEEIQKELSMPLAASNLSLRASRKMGDKVFCLVYKDARVDFERLNEVVGIFGWKREHVFIDEKNYCTVSLKDPESGEWVSKQDVGTESKTEAEKGQSSDAFKRACFNWGIGLELYNMPVISVPIAYEKSLSKLKMNVAYLKDNPRELAAMSLEDMTKPEGKRVIFSYACDNISEHKKNNNILIP